MLLRVQYRSIIKIQSMSLVSKCETQLHDRWNRVNSKLLTHASKLRFTFTFICGMLIVFSLSWFVWRLSLDLGYNFRDSSQKHQAAFSHELNIQTQIVPLSQHQSFQGSEKVIKTFYTLKIISLIFVSVFN